MAGDKKKENKFSRRDFVLGSGTAIAGGALTVISAAAPAAVAEDEKPKDLPLSTKYLLCDTKHCAGCYSCVMACSLVHDGAVSFSLSRVQVHRAVLNKYPTDIQIHQCRQCPDAPCVKSCPVGACHVSTENGNIRMIDSEKCIGCQKCIKACPFTPHRTIWNSAAKKSTKCDFCTNTPYFHKKGGVDGAQACVDVCPSNALKVVETLPSEPGGYDIDLAPPAGSGGRGGRGFGGFGGFGGGGRGGGGLGGPAPKTGI
jgi:protein NrfC